MQTDHDNEKRNLTVLKKQAKKIEKAHANVDKLSASLAAKKSERNTMEERLNSTKPLDDIKKQEAGLQRQDEEDQTIIDDPDAPPSDKEAARERIEERQEEHARL